MLTSIRVNILRQHIRLYHESSSRLDKRVPMVKKANARVSRTITRKFDYEVAPKVDQFSPSTRFEPFPFAVTEENKNEVLKRVITPLFDVPYEEQLSSKESFCRNALRLLAQELYKSGTPVRLDVKRLPCHVNTIVRSTQLAEYRNKDEFSIWRGLDGETVTAGYLIFPIGKHGNSICVEPDGCEVIKKETKEVSSLINEFLRTKAKLPVCYSLGTDGGWRRFLIRVNSEGQLMVVGFLNPRGLRVQQVLDERDNFRDFMVQRCEESKLDLISLYYQPCPHNKCKHQDVPYELLHGKPSIEEKLGQHKYMISPESFMHDSTKGAEILYETVKNTIEECFSYKERGIKPLVIDAHCGIGTLAMNLADMAQHIVGIDNSSQAIDDARANARLNNIENAEFICSNLEIVLGRILEKYSKFKSDILVVCDAPKSGLHPNVIDVLRNSHDVKKILFITPKINGPHVMKNLLGLCGKGQARSLPPFAPLLATPVDVYPHIELFQTILALERLPQ